MLKNETVGVIAEYIRQIQDHGEFSLPGIARLGIKMLGTEKVLVSNSDSGEPFAGPDFETWANANSKTSAAREIKECCAQAIQALDKTATVALGTLGVIHRHFEPGREGRNPQTGEIIRIPGKSGIYFFPRPDFLELGGASFQPSRAALGVFESSPEIERLLTS